MMTTNDPKQALSAEQLAQVRADLELVEPKKCTLHYRDTETVERLSEDCGRPAVQQAMLACGHVVYRCAEHTSGTTPQSSGYQRCVKCGWRGLPGDHCVAVMPV